MKEQLGLRKTAIVTLMARAAVCLFYCVVLAALGAALAPRAEAAVYNWNLWTDGATGNWTNTANWTPATGYPGSNTGDRAMVQLMSTPSKTVTIVVDSVIPNALSDGAGSLYLENESGGRVLLVVTNGGRWISTAGGFIYHGADVLVTDGGELRMSGSDHMGFAATGTTVRVQKGASVTAGGYNFAVSYNGTQPGGVNCSLTITGAGTTWTNTSTFSLAKGIGSVPAVSNTVSLLDGARFKGVQDVRIGNKSNDMYNAFIISGTGTILEATSFTVGQVAGSRLNSLNINSGAVVNLNSTFAIGNAAGSVSNACVIGGAGSYTCYTNSSASVVGNNGSASNTLTLTNACMISPGNALTVGSGAGANGNLMTIASGGYLYQGDSIWVGTGCVDNELRILRGGSAESAWFLIGRSSGTGNRVVVDGGLLTLTTQTMEVNDGNVITNAGGVYQFASATPTITLNGSGSVHLNGGAIAFRNVKGVDVRGNWSGTQLTKIAFSGANAFRLNNSTNSTSTDQTYWFDSGAAFGATNYAGLEMVNGGTAYTNGSVTIGTNGWLTLSNTTAILGGAVTNYGALRFASSTATFKSSLVLQTGSSLAVSSTNNLPMIVNGVLTLNGGAVTFPANMPRDASFTLFTSSNTIDGRVANLSLPPTQRAVLSGDSKSVLIEPHQTGFVFMLY